MHTVVLDWPPRELLFNSRCYWRNQATMSTAHILPRFKACLYQKLTLLYPV